MFKTMYILSVFCVLFSINVFSQALPASSSAALPDSTRAKDSASVEKLSEKLDALLSMLKSANITDKELTGIIFYDTSRSVPVYTYNDKKTARTIVVDQVLLLVQDGYIIDIQVFSGNKVFTNTKAPISINGKRFSSQVTDYLYNKENELEKIILQEAVFYIPLSTFSPEDGLLTLTNKHYKDTLSKNIGINTILDLRLYTDALAALGKEPNGVFQTDLRIKQFLHRRHYKNRGSRIFQYIKINATASKLDSKNSFVDSSSAISRSALMQKSKINVEGIINGFGSWLGRKTLNTYYLDFGGGINSVNLAGLKDTASIIVPCIFVEAGVCLKNSSNVGFDFHGRYTFQYSPQTDFNNQDGDVKFLRIGAEIFWNPFKDPANRVFGRANYILGLSNEEKKRSFSQVQVGYSTLLSKAIGKK